MNEGALPHPGRGNLFLKLLLTLQPTGEEGAGGAERAGP